MNQKIAVKSETSKPIYESNAEGKFVISYPDSDYVGNGIRLLKRTYPIPPTNICEPTLSENLIAFHTTHSTYIEKQIAGSRKAGRITNPGTFTLIPAFCDSSWNWSREMEFFLIYLSSSLFKKVALETFDKTPQSIELIDRLAVEDTFLEQLATALQKELESPYPVNQLYVESLQNVIAVHLLRHHCQVTLGKIKLIQDGLSQRQQKQVIEFIIENLDRKLSLKEISQQLEISPYHFCRLFKQSTGITPYQYVKQKRIERAKQLLKQKQPSIVEVALICGFSCQSTFTTSFRQATGVTPKQYRVNS